MKKKDTLIVVLARNYSTGLSIIRSLAKVGYTVDLIYSSNKKSRAAKIILSSKYINKYKYIIAKKTSTGYDDNIYKAIMKYKDLSKEKNVILFPCDDYNTSLLDSNKDELSKYFLMPQIVNGKKGDIINLMDKSIQNDIAKKVGLRTPKEWIVSLKDGEDISIPKDMMYPCFCKPLISISGYKTEMARCNDYDELYNHLKETKKKASNREILIQEFLNIENEIVFSGVCLDQEIIIPGILRKTMVGNHEKGVTITGYIAPFEELGEEQEKIVKMLQQYHYLGMFDVELIIVDGKIYFNEVNLRSSGSNYAYFQSGANLPNIVVDELLGKKHNKEEETVNFFGKKILYEKVAFEDYYHNFDTKKGLRKKLRDSEIRILKDNDDPRPYITFRIVLKLMFTKKKIKNCLRKIKKGIKVFIKNILSKSAKYILRLPQARINHIPRSNDKKTAIVVGRNYLTNLTTAKSLGKAGYRVEVLRIYNFGIKSFIKNYIIRPMPDAHSKYVQEFHACFARKKANKVLEKLLSLADPNNKILLLPVDDFSTYTVDKYYKELEEHYLMPHIEQNKNIKTTINELVSKEVQKEIARKHNVPVANGCVIEVYNRDNERSYAIPDTVKYPCFLKPNVSMSSSKSKMAICNNKSELDKAIERFSNSSYYSVLVEDFICIKNEYSFLGICAKNEVIMPAYFKALVGESSDHRGVAITGKTLPVEDFYKKIYTNLCNMMKSLNFVGIFDIDLIEDINGNIYFAEINFRMGASGYAFTECGINLPKIFADYMFDNKKLDAKCKNEKPGSIFVSERGLLDSYMVSSLSKKDVKNIASSADIHFIEDKDDIKPFKHFKKYFFYIDFFGIRAKYRKKNAERIMEPDVVKLNSNWIRYQNKLHEERIYMVMDRTGWSYEEASKKMEDAEKKYGITDSRYVLYELFNVDDKYLEEYYLNARKKRVKERKDFNKKYIEKIMEATGWSEKKTKKAVDEATERTGCTTEEYYIYKFYELKHSEQNEVLTFSYSKNLSAKYDLDPKFGATLRNKVKTNEYFKDYVKRNWCNNKNITFEKFSDMFKDCNKIIYKPISGKEGKGIEIFELEKNNIKNVFDNLINLPEGVVEEYIVQNKKLSSLVSEKVSTIRVVTLSSPTMSVTAKGEHFKVVYATIRMVSKDSITDNLENDGVGATINLKTGKIMTNGVDRNGNVYELNPTTNMPIKGFKVPGFKKALKLIENACADLNVEGHLGWDIAISENGPDLIEVNLVPGVAIIGITAAQNKKGLKKELQKYLDR